MDTCQVGWYAMLMTCLGVTGLQDLRKEIPLLPFLFENAKSRVFQVLSGLPWLTRLYFHCFLSEMMCRGSVNFVPLCRQRRVQWRWDVGMTQTVSSFEAKQMNIQIC